MFKGSANVVLPTSIIGSLPRPHWYTATLGRRSFLEAMVNSRFREQYEDAVSSFLRAQEIAGIDICTDGDAHYDEEVGGMSWQSYPIRQMSGFAERAKPVTYAGGGAAFPRGHILHDVVEARVLPRIVGPVGPGDLQYVALWKTAQRMTKRPVKFGTILPEILAASVEDEYYKDPVERTWAFSDVLNAELNLLADAGCQVIQMEEPMIHSVPARGKAFGKLDVDDLVKVFNNTSKGLRDKAEVWCHTCWGNPCQQRIWDQVQSYRPTLEALNMVDADALTFETCSVGPGDLHAIGKIIKEKKLSSVSSIIVPCRWSDRRKSRRSFAKRSNTSSRKGLSFRRIAEWVAKEWDAGTPVIKWSRWCWGRISSRRNSGSLRLNASRRMRGIRSDARYSLAP